KHSRPFCPPARYSTCLKDWYEKYLKKVVNLTLDAKHQGDEIWAIGGGCLLPGFKKLLEKNGFTILDNPVEANVSGLLEMAKTISAKNSASTSIK
ncbi:MAG: hypothetical protein ACYTXM_37795, partial [Nostoc sp.]